MILHIIPAEKFVNRAVSLFDEAFPNKNEFYVFTYGNDERLDYLSESIIKKVTIVNQNAKWWVSNFINLSKYNNIVLHNLYSDANIYFANNFNCGPVSAIIWGYEFYGIAAFWGAKKFGELTRKLKIDNSNFVENQNKIQKSATVYKVERAIKLIFNKRYRYNNPTLKTKIKAFKKIDVILSHVETDIKNIIKRFNINPSKGTFSYYTYEDYSKNITKLKFLNNILVGNSATNTNNHLEVFEILASREQNFKIVCPLSYGNMDYAELIKQVGYKKFNDRFQPIVKFLTLEDYNNLQAQCGVVIMNHYRQQAAGNIIAALILGSKVFMSKKSPLYKHFKTIGIHLFTVEENLNEEDALDLLEPLQVERNRIILKKYYSRNAIMRSLNTHIKA